MALPLSKTLDPADTFDDIVADLVDRHFTSAREQHPMRRWEYQMALTARRAWLQWDYEHYGHANRAHGHIIADVGGAGSPFAAIVGEDAGQTVRVIDPDGGMALDQFLRWRGNLCHEVFCLSVLEHVDDLDQFLYHLSCLVAPGGLLFLTMDCVRGVTEYDWPVDTFHFHWMRKRIFNDWARGRLEAQMLQHQFKPLNYDIDRAYHGDHVYDYSFAALALQKRP